MILGWLVWAWGHYSLGAGFKDPLNSNNCNSQKNQERSK
jgi:hypothetical protein